MNLKKVFLIKLLILVIALSLIGPVSSQGQTNKTIMYTGVIQMVTRDFKYIALNTVEHNIPITPQTKVFDERGNSLKVNDLRRGLNIAVEMIRNPDGSTEKRIIVKK